jgi:hypothetical protein
MQADVKLEKEEWKTIHDRKTRVAYRAIITLGGVTLSSTRIGQKTAEKLRAAGAVLRQR